MLRIILYKVIPFFTFPEKIQDIRGTRTEWFRLVINDLANQNGGRLKDAGIDTKLFHNHKENPDHTNPRYPLIIYHFYNDEYLFMGINQGTDALKELVKPLKELTKVHNELFLKFELVEKEYEIDVRNSKSFSTYSLTDWLPFNRKTHKEFIAANTVIEKTMMLEKKLLSDIIKHFAKFLQLDLSSTVVNILDFDSFHRPNIKLKVDDQLYSYQPVSLVFSTNINLPEFITLGNKTAFGFGRVNIK